MKWLVLIFLLIGFLGYLFWNKNFDLLSPLSGKKNLINNDGNITKVGFLPTWMVEKTIEYTDEIDKLIFLGVEVDEKGNLVWDSQSKKIENEVYLKQKELIWKNGGKNILGIKLFDDEKLDKLLGSTGAIDNLVNQLRDLFERYGFDGINIDFEYMNNPTAILSEKMFIFLDKLKKEDLGEISVDVFVNTVIKGEKEKLTGLISNIDHLIIMAYDFHRPGSDFAGPVAPIKAPVGERSIMELIERIEISNLSKNKIVLAYPLYGYEWKVYRDEFGAAVKSGWSALASYKRMVEMVKTDFAKASSVKWDEESMTPWISFWENGEIHQIYFENLESMKRKLELVKNNQIGGVGFWALGYEGESRDFWKNLRIDDESQIR